MTSRMGTVYIDACSSGAARRVLEAINEGVRGRARGKLAMRKDLPRPRARGDKY